MDVVSRDLCLDVCGIGLNRKGKDILQNIWTTARSGQILALIGPTGSGKTTLIDVISGRQQPSNGIVKLNNLPFSKDQRRRLAYVQQDETFFSQLTLWETLSFTARLRLPESMTDQEKKRRLDTVVDMLKLRKCVSTVIGDTFVKGLSGGEKKRASIACELLVDPDILLLDEPTSGLDSTTATMVIREMKQMVTSLNKLMIISIHQASVSIYSMLDKVIVLHDGQIVFDGQLDGVYAKLRTVGLNVKDSNSSPAEVLLDLCHEEENAAKLKDLGKLCMVQNETNKGTYENTGRYEGKAENGHHNPTFTGEDFSDVQTVVQFGSDVASNTDKRHKWATSWGTQFRVLLWRSFRQNVRVLRQGYDVSLTLCISVLTALVFWNLGIHLRTFRDVQGMIYIKLATNLKSGQLSSKDWWKKFKYMYFINPAADSSIPPLNYEDNMVCDDQDKVFYVIGHWHFLSAMGTFSIYLSERYVFNRERTSGAYRLSAYFLAKTTSDLVFLTLTVVMWTIVYWAIGLRNVGNYFATTAIALMHAFASQGIGLLVAIHCSDARMGMTVLFSFLIGTYLIGGFIILTFPSWLGWIIYLSPLLYAYEAITILISDELSVTPCDQTLGFEFPHCLTSNRDNVTVTATDILMKSNIDIPLKCYLLTITLIIVVCRVVCYLSLRIKNKL